MSDDAYEDRTPKQEPEDVPSLPASADFDDEADSRPNKWRGHPSTWRTWTEAERQTWAAYEGTRRSDLSIHLYNAFALRKGLRKGPDVEDDTPQTPWDPGKTWTAWPMPVDEVPDDGLLPQTADDINEPFTLRRDGAPPFAGCRLEEEIAAVMLRYAMERLRRRGLDGGVGGSSGGNTSGPGVKGGGQDQVMPSIESAGEATATEDDPGETTGRDDETDSPGRADRLRLRKRHGAGSPLLVPTVSADDERSYALLRPEARRIMARLDDTLTILHNQRVAGLGHMSSSSWSEASVEDEDEDEQNIKQEPDTPAPSSSPSPPPVVRTGRRGRPRRAYVPLEGETEREMLIRIAREQKKKIPRFEDDEDSQDWRSQSHSRSRSRRRRQDRSQGRSQSQQDTEGRKPQRLRAVSVASSRASSLSRPSSMSRASSKSSVTSEKNREKLFSRWGLRDWRDVLGAAAMAGFPPKVIARAAQRCATLFREEITMNTLDGPQGGIQTAHYVPDAPLPASSDEESDSDVELRQLRAVSRQASIHPGASPSPEPEPEPRRGRSRSRSRSSFTTSGYLMCPHSDCPKSVEGFTTGYNLRRHLRNFHGDSTAEVTTDAELTDAEGTRSRAYFRCPHPGCPRGVEGFTKKSNFERHLREVHRDESPLPSPTLLTDAEITEPETRGRSRSRRRRSRSGTPATASHLCPYPTCPRAVEGFAKRTNLIRHLREVHGRTEAAARKAAGMEDEDSVDEMEGGVHADWFLRPIKIRKGWRGEDTTRRPPKRACAASEELDSYL